MTTYPTQSAFRKALGVSKATMSRYTRREDWPVSRVAPWSRDDLAAVADWQAEFLQEDRAAEAREDAAHAEQNVFTDDARFGVAWGILGRAVRPVDGDALKQPAELCSPADRAVLTDKRTLTKKEVKKLVAATVTLRVELLRIAQDIAPWLVRRSADDIRRRLHAAINEPLAVYAAATNDTADARKLGIFSFDPDDSEASNV